MATLGGTVLNIADWAKRLDPNGNTSEVINLLSQDNEILTDMLFMEANGPTSHRSTRITGEPTVAFRTLNAGVTPSKATTDQVDDTMGIIETYSEIDKDLCELNGNTASFRLSEERPFLSAINKLAAETLIYGNTNTSPEKFLGFAPRFSALTSGNYDNSMITAGGSGSDNTSIWMVVWGQNTVHGIFPKGSKAGIVQEDKGVVTVETATGIGGGRMEAYRTRWQWKLGLSVRDWRYVVRICNIDTSLLVANSSPVDLINLMSRMFDRIPSFGMGRPVIYCNRTVFSWLRVQALAKSNYALDAVSALDQFGNPISGGLNFMGVPIRRVDQILANEATIA